MKKLLLLFLLAWALPAFSADGASYDWIIEQYRKGDFKYAHVEGRIDGEDYVAMQILLTEQDDPSFLLFKKTADQFDVIAKVYNFFGAEFDFEIRDDSPYFPQLNSSNQV